MKYAVVAIAISIVIMAMTVNSTTPCLRFSL
ncbi:MAG: hypothetical protein IK093_12430 [Ruminiclostridium sp.]|nr:hypothetical protein [Ruminiclostridium sp.]